MNARQDLHGPVPGLSFPDYLAAPAVSNSALKLLRKSPAHLAAGRDPDEQQKPSLRRGSLLHTLTLEPHLMASRYRVKPDGMSFSTKEGKAWREETPAGVEIVTQAETRAANRQARHLRAVPEIGALLGEGQAEVSFFWVDEQTGLRCKGRADWVHRTEAGVILLDLKTAEDASPDIFPKACARYGYHMQAAWYADGWTAATGDPVLGFVFGAVESGWPHVAAAYMLDDESTTKGRAESRRLLNRYAECREADTWPGYQTAIQSITLPAWA